MAKRKIQQAPPDYTGKTHRNCAVCSVSFRSRRQTKCKTCKRAHLVEVLGEEAADNLDKRARDLGYSDWYDFTDS